MTTSKSNNTVFFNRTRETMDWKKRRVELNKQFLLTFERAFLKSKAYPEIYKNAGITRSDVRSLDDIEKLPLLRINDLVERQETDFPFGGFNILDPRKMERIFINPGFILKPGHKDDQDISWAEALCGAGFEKGDRIINTFNYHLWPFGLILDKCVRRIGATAIPTGVGNTLLQVKIMQKMMVEGFLGTPSFLMTLSQRAEGMGLNPRVDLSLKTAMVAAEMLPESLRHRIENKLEITVRQGYGTVFLGCIGYECFHKTGLHVPDNILVELVDPKTGKKVPPGTPGEIVATNFSPSYPMIRMTTGDLSMMITETCPCGRTGPILKKILGRIDQATKVRGTFIHPWQTDEVIARYPEIYKYQVVITREKYRDVMTFMIELKEGVRETEGLRARIERDIKDLLTIREGVRTVPLGTIPDMHQKIEDRRRWE